MGAVQRRPAEIRAWLDSLAQFSDKIPPLPKTISHEWIYQVTTKWPLLRAWWIRMFPLRMTRRLDPQHKVVASACYTHQNIAELWNTMTHPAERNGLGLQSKQG
jgi:hypothetical protein